MPITFIIIITRFMKRDEKETSHVEAQKEKARRSTEFGQGAFCGRVLLPGGLIVFAHKKAESNDEAQKGDGNLDQVMYIVFPNNG